MFVLLWCCMCLLLQASNAMSKLRVEPRWSVAFALGKRSTENPEERRLDACFSESCHAELLVSEPRLKMSSVLEEPPWTNGP